MSNDKHEFCGSISVRIGTSRHKLDLSPAEHYGGPQGLFRARFKRRWVNGQDGMPLFFDEIGLGEFIAAQMFGNEIPLLPAKAPDVPRNSRVTVKFWQSGMPRTEGAFTLTPPHQGYDGKYYVWVMTYSAGLICVSTNDITLHKSHKIKKELSVTA